MLADIDLQMGLADSDVYRVSRVYPEDISLLALPFQMLRSPEMAQALFHLITNPESLIARAFTNPVEFRLGKVSFDMIYQIFFM